MPWSGGVFSRTNGTHTGTTVWAQDAAAGTGIVTGAHDTHDQDIASGINNCVAKDGSNTPTGNLPMGGNKHTGAGQASGAGQYMEYAQVNTLLAGYQSLSSVLTALASYVTTDGSGDFTFPDSLSIAGNSNLLTFSLSSYGDLTEVSPPSAPASGYDRLYAKAGGLLALQNSAGLEKQFGKAPTVQTFTGSGASGTYTPSTGTVRARVRMVGAGGGGSAATTNGGSAGGNTSFGSWVANGGNGGIVAAAGVGVPGGSGGANGTGTLVMRIAGNCGGISNIGISYNSGGGMGAPGPWGGAGPASFDASGTKAGGAATGPGAGGGGGSSSASTGFGGGGGEYVEFWVEAPGATSYTVGSLGSGGAAGFAAGGNGYQGIIIIEEFYN